MRTSRLISVLAAAVIAVLAAPGAAHAATISQPFAANSGDACRYGTTAGTLNWHFGATSPLPGLGVDVKGTLTDHPQPIDPVTTCRDDGYYSTVTFVAYAGSVEVDRQSRSANNTTTSFTFALGGSATTSTVNRVVVQVCRSPLVTLPPSYCGAAVVYNPPPIA
ncbi:hypothetical protein [Hamadaea tsunoensis]|uniref:hypothetical protein n=1 Tax=Hamadaea tsunoensis TaxID=53368 RepID=UPI00040AC441|nr:hypothetical protein [Hamadaea tsunoensis]